MSNYEATLDANHIIMNLKRKINLQVEKLIENEKMLSKKDEEILRLTEENINLKRLLEETEQRGAAVTRGNNSIILDFTESFCNIISKIINNNDIIPYKNYTKNSARYCKVEKNIFDQYVEEESDTDRKDFLNWCIDFGYIKSDENRKHVFNDNQKRIYFLNKALIKILYGDENA